MSNLEWVLGISVDDQLSWGVAPVDPDWAAYMPEAFPRLDFPHGKIVDFKPHRKSNTPIPLDIGAEIKSLLYTLLDDNAISKLMRKVVSVGVSTIGVTDHRANRLIDLRRKDCIRRGGEEYIVDFENIISDVFRGTSFSWHRSHKIAVQNDATAKCLAHYRFQDALRKSQTLCYINLSEGVNIGLANGFGPVASSHFHPELGHAYPQREVWDLNHDAARYDGCPAHVNCYEGLLSTNRIRGEWGDDLENLPLKGPAWQLVPSYVGQLSWIAAAATCPHMIWLGGPTACLPLVDAVRAKFDALNIGVGEKPYLQYPSNRIGLAPDFPIKSDGSIDDTSGLMGALELARRRVLRPDHIGRTK